MADDLGKSERKSSSGIVIVIFILMASFIVMPLVFISCAQSTWINAQGPVDNVVAVGNYDYAEYSNGGRWGPSWTIVHFEDGRTYRVAGMENIVFAKGTKIRVLGWRGKDFGLKIEKVEGS